MNNYHGHNLSEYAFKYNAEERLRIYSSNFFNSMSGAIYRKWNKSCDKFYQPVMDWDELFPLRNPIQYQSSMKIVGNTRFYKNEDKVEDIYLNGKKIEREFYPLQALKARNQSKKNNLPEHEKFFELPIKEPSGYLIPSYEFYNSRQFKNNSSFEEAYNDALSLFNTEENSKISVNKYTVIGNYRDVLFSQLERQVNQIQYINREIAKIFKIYYFEFERAIVIEKSNEQSEGKIEKIHNLWMYIKSFLMYIYVYRIQDGDSLRQIEQENSNFNHLLSGQFEDTDQSFQRYVQHSNDFILYNNKLIEKKLLDSIYSGFRDLMKAKEPILETAKLFASKILPLESMLEDFFLNQEIKSPEEFIKQYDQENDQNKQQRVYGIHAINSDWIQKTFDEQMSIRPSQNQAVKETKKLYYAEFKLSISESQILRICGVYK